jgi:RNA polymerase sigma factor (sigma-70 family)
MADDDSLVTEVMHDCIDRHRTGDAKAADRLINAAKKRLEKLAHKVFANYKTRRCDIDASDMLQGALMRLVRSLTEVRPDSTRSFFNLAAVHMRRELLDMIRKANRRPTIDASVGDEEGVGVQTLPAPVDADLDRWAALHVAVEQLPVDEREVIGLTFYHGWSQMEIAVLLQISDRQVRRIWNNAIRHLSTALGGQLPEM